MEVEDIEALLLLLLKATEDGTRRKILLMLTTMTNAGMWIGSANHDLLWKSMNMMLPLLLWFLLLWSPGMRICCTFVAYQCLK